jgi:hypothetical protein
MVVPGDAGVHLWKGRIPHDPWEATMAHLPTHRRNPLDADGRPLVNPMVALLAAAAVFLLVLATSAISDRLVG